MSALCQFSDCENGFSDIENICGFCNALLLHQTKCMCHYQTLFHDDSIGYVVRCTECEKLQIGYGNIMVTYTQEDFDSFRWWLKKIKDEQHPSQNPTLRCIVIPTPCDGMKLLLSMKELKDFYNMLEQADSELQSLELMRLFTDEKK